MSWPMVALGEICDLFNGYAFKSSDYVELSNTLSCRMSNIRPGGEFNIDYNARYLPDDFKEKYNAFILKDNDVIIAMTDLAGEPKILGVPTVVRTSGRNILLNQRVGKLNIIEPNRVYFPYLKFALSDPKVRSIYKKFAGGGLQINLGKDDLLSVKIPLPPLETQKQIAAVLEKADQLRKDCKLMEQELNSLAQSVFIDMFGDPVTNPNGWEVKAISEVANVVTGNTPSRAKSEYYGNHIEWIKSGNINTPSHYLTVSSEHLSEKGKGVGRSVDAGAVLMTCIAGSPECIGNVAIADRSVTFNQQINALVPKKKLLNTEFIYVLLIVGKKIIQAASTNSMKGMISKGKLEEIRLPIPPYEQQCDFSQKFKKLELIVTEYSKQVEQADEMFGSLMKKAFKGELNLKTKAA